MEKIFSTNVEILKQQILKLNTGIKEKLHLKIFFLIYTFFAVLLLIINNTNYLKENISLSITDTLTFGLYFYLPLFFKTKTKNYYKNILITVLLIFIATFLFKITANFIFIFLYILVSLCFLNYLRSIKINIFNLKKDFLKNFLW